MKTPEEIVLCPGCYGYGVLMKPIIEEKNMNMIYHGFEEGICDRCLGSGRVIQWTEDKPMMAVLPNA